MVNYKCTTENKKANLYHLQCTAIVTTEMMVIYSQRNLRVLLISSIISHKIECKMVNNKSSVCFTKQEHFTRTLLLIIKKGCFSLFFFGCSEVNSTWLITSNLANQRGRKVLFTYVVCIYIILLSNAPAPKTMVPSVSTRAQIT